MMRGLRAIDETINVMSEDLARMVSRRSVLGKAFKGIVGGVAAGTVGSLATATSALASCTCGYINNNNCGGGCQYGGCPSGYSACNTSMCGSCIHPTGWVACDNLCTCHFGYRVCTDCTWCTSCGCSAACTCLSGVICCGCCSPRDVAEEHLKVLAARN
jgi:hypothetical protein